MRDAGHRTPDAGRRTSDIGHRTSDGEKSKNNISTPQGGGHNYFNLAQHFKFCILLYWMTIYKPPKSKTNRIQF